MSLFSLRKEAHWSFSSLNTYLNICSLRYAFEYVYGLEREKVSASLPFGRAFHAALSEYAISTMSGKAMELSEVQEAFCEYLSIELNDTENICFKEGESPESLRERGMLMLAIALENWKHDERVTDIAKAFSAELPQASKVLIGEMDMLVRSQDGKPVIVDWKSSASKWPHEKADKDLQATCFSYAYFKESGIIPDFRFDVVTKAKNPAFESHWTRRDEDDFLRLFKLIHSVEKAVRAEVFLPADNSFSCKECAYASACRNWHRKKLKFNAVMSAA